MEITIGLTQSDRANDYVSYDDGYRKGAKQEKVKVYVIADLLRHTTDEGLLEALYEVTNVRGEFGLPSDQVKVYLLGAIGEYPHRSLSIGDTVSFDGLTWALGREGWYGV